MTALIITTAATAAVGFRSSAPGSVAAESVPLAGAQRTEAPRATGAEASPRGCRDHRIGVAFYRSRFAAWRARRSIPTDYPAGRKPRNCADALYLAKTWRTRAFYARVKWEEWLAAHTLSDFKVEPGNFAWLSAVNEAQKVYPGTMGWLLSCSAPTSEGGHGRWIPNTQGSGAGGWLQFMRSTFWRMFGAAREEARAWGFRLPASAASWYSPLGQALAGAWAVIHNRTHEWAGSGC